MEVSATRGRKALAASCPEHVIRRQLAMMCSVSAAVNAEPTQLIDARLTRGANGTRTFRDASGRIMGTATTTRGR